MMLDSSIPDSCVNIDGFSVIRKDRNRQGGGVIAYVKSNIIYNVRHDLSDDELEPTVLQINPYKQNHSLYAQRN